MNIDKNLVQKLITEGIGPDYIISNINDTIKYVFINYQHREYEPNDPRSHLIGAGPVVYNKETKEYKLLGSGDYISGDYMQYNQLETEDEFQLPTPDEIIERIKRRNYINDDDILLLAHLEDYDGSLTYNRDNKHIIFETNNKLAISSLMDLFNKLGHSYEIILPNRIMVERTRKE